MANAIQTENLNTGTTAWLITQASTTQIQGYVSACSVDPGGSLSVYVSTQVASTIYSIQVFRLGYYGGTGARLMLAVPGQVGVAQGYFDNSDLSLHNCPTAFIDGTTGLIEARFASSYTLNIPSTWVTGAYLILFTDANGFQSYAHFTVRCAVASTNTYVIVLGDTTYCAYNNWGGKSLYTFNSTSGVAAVKDSFDRPSVQFLGGDYLLRNDINFIKWAESQGYDIGYLSNIDVHANGYAALSGHKVYIALSHDEYWTLEYRTAVESARSHGIGLGFMSANSCYWQARLEAGGQNGTNRTLVCYRVASTDPQNNVDNTRVTVQWRQQPVSRPEDALIGILFRAVVQSINYGWTVDAGAGSLPWLAGTGLVAGNSYGTDLVGNEFDNQQPGGAPNVQLLGTTAVTSNIPQADISHTSIYRDVNGALVFASGSISWTWALDPYRYQAANVAVVGQMQALMANIMVALIRKPSFSMVGV